MPGFGAMALHTVGHGSLTADELTRLLGDAGIERLVDVRSYPGSRRHPHFGRRRMEGWLPEAGIGYRWEPALGGCRRPVPDSPQTALRVEGFRAYADHMRTAEFAAALDRVLGEAEGAPTAVMCAESVWWRCHRSLLADAAALLRRVEVIHLLPDGRRQPHRPHGEARVDDAGLLVYDGGAPTLPLD